MSDEATTPPPPPPPAVAADTEAAATESTTTTPAVVDATVPTEAVVATEAEQNDGDDDAAPAEEEENTTANFAPVVCRSKLYMIVSLTVTSMPYVEMATLIYFVVCFFRIIKCDDLIYMMLKSLSYVYCILRYNSKK